MTKLRVLIFLITLTVVGTLGYMATLYARGYRLNTETYKFLPSGLLVAKSNPDGAQVIIDGERKGATNQNFSLAPGVYEIEIKKEGFRTWKKDITIEKEVVTEFDAILFKSAPSLSAITLVPTESPLPSSDFSKIAYIVPATREILEDDKEGLWVIDTLNLPLGFARDPRRVTNGDLEGVYWEFSPDQRQILVETEKAAYLLDTGSYTPQEERINIASQIKEVKKDWEDENKKKLTALLRGLPEEIVYVMEEKASKVLFSPDETKVLYLASGDINLVDDIIKFVPGASTQKQERDIKEGKVYVYDIKEDRNFLIDTLEDFDINECPNLKASPAIVLSCTKTVSWFPTSRQIVIAEEDKITITDYDGTNKQEIYQGSYLAPNAFPVVSTDRLMILTNLGSNSTPPNLYNLSVK